MFLVVKGLSPGVWNGMVIRCLSFLLIPTLFATTVRADDAPLSIRLVSEVTSISPGEPFYLGLALKHETHYHSYWKHPGTVGVPTNIQWLGLPTGFKAEPIDWPEPEPVLMFQIKAQGYERDVVLPIRITPPANLEEGREVKLTGKASWMVCDRQCHPGFKDLSIVLPVRRTATPAWDAKLHPKFEAERALRPRVSQAWTADMVSEGRKIVITLKPGPGAAVIPKEAAAKIQYFTEDGMVDSDKPQSVEVLPDGAVRLTLVEAEFIVGDRPKALSGVVLYKAGWEEGGQLRCMKVVAAMPTVMGRQQ